MEKLNKQQLLAQLLEIKVLRRIVSSMQNDELTGFRLGMAMHLAKRSEA